MSCFSRYFEFYINEDKTLSMQLNSLNSASGCKEPIDLTGATQIEVTLPASPANLVLNLTSTPPVVVDDARVGKIHMDLAAAETAVMVTGPIVVRITNAGKMIQAVANAGVKKLEILSC